MTSKEFVERVYALNLVAGVNEVQYVATQVFEDCEIRQMGYYEGYSPIIEDGEVLLRDYLNKITDVEIDDDIFENLDNTDYAFGTIYIDLGDKNYQIYHKGIGEWGANDSDSEFYELGSYENAIQFILQLGKENQ